MCPWLLVATWWSHSLHHVLLPQCWSNWSASSEWVSGSKSISSFYLQTPLYFTLYSRARKYRWRTAVSYCAPLAFVVAINCWSVSLASRTQVTLTFIKMFALVLIIIPGVIALAKGGRMWLLPLKRWRHFKLLRAGKIVIICCPCIFFYTGKTDNFQNGFEVDSLTLDKIPLAFYNGLYAYGGW